MKTKIVYVLTSSEQDFYLEQTLMSVYSARLHNPDANIILVTDTQTAESCRDGLRRDFLSFFSEIKTIDIPEYPKPKERSRYLKTTLREIIEGDYLFIDGDTIICDTLEEIDDLNATLAFALDIHLQKQDWTLFLEEEHIAEVFGTADVEKHYNSGVSFVKDCPEMHHFFKIWHEEWRKSEQKGNLRDQPALHYAIARTGVAITELNGIWNCQISSNFLPYLHRAKILHTFSSANFEHPCIFKDHALLEEIRAHGGLTTRCKQLIASPKEAFHPVNLVLGTDGARMMRSPLMRHAFYMHKHYRPLYNILESTSCLLRRICDVINRIRVQFT